MQSAEFSLVLGDALLLDRIRLAVGWLLLNDWTHSLQMAPQPITALVKSRTVVD